MGKDYSRGWNQRAVIEATCASPPFACSIFAVSAATAVHGAIEFLATIHLVSLPLKEQGDHAQDRELLKQAGADGHHRQSARVVVIEDRVYECDGVENGSG